MIERIENNGELFSVIIKAAYKTDGIEFFTPNNFSQQLGYMNRPKGYIIQPHMHKLVERKVVQTQEVLYIKSGIVRVNFYTEDMEYLQSRDLSSGDVILLAAGGHGFEILEQAEIIEIKQGPYVGEEDKIKFHSVN